MRIRKTARYCAIFSVPSRAVTTTNNFFVQGRHADGKRLQAGVDGAKPAAGGDGLAAHDLGRGGEHTLSTGGLRHSSPRHLRPRLHHQGMYPLFHPPLYWQTNDLLMASILVYTVHWQTWQSPHTRWGCSGRIIFFGLGWGHSQSYHPWNIVCCSG